LRGELVRQIVRPKSCERGWTALWARAPAAASAPDPVMNNGFMLRTVLKFPTADDLREYSILQGKGPVETRTVSE